MSEALRAALADRAVALSQTVLDRMYENPFWMERYGERGRRFANEDSLHHVNYLIAALAAGESGVFVRYATWLRSVLVSRGMCSEHLAENFRLLAQAIVTADLPDASAAVDILEEADASLRYSQGDAGRVEAARGQLLAAMEHADGAHAVREDDRRYLFSYLADAAAGADPAAFTTFAARAPQATVTALAEEAATLGVRWPEAPRSSGNAP